MTSFCVLLDDTRPKAHVANAPSARAAQILCRLLEERFPGSTFILFEDRGDLHPPCHPSIRDGAHSFEVKRLVAAELVLEERANPERLPKWCVFKHRNGGVTAWPDHVTGEVQAFRADHDVVEERAAYAQALGPADAFAVFDVGETTKAAS